MIILDNPIFQELPDEDTCFSAKNDEKIYLDLRASSGYVKEAEKLERNDSKINLQITLKDVADFRLRVRIWAYSLSEYLHVLSKSGLTLKHRFFGMKRGKQTVKKRYLVYWWKKKTKKKKQKGSAIPYSGLIASLAAPVLGEIAKPVFKTIFGRERKRRKWYKKQ